MSKNETDSSFIYNVRLVRSDTFDNSYYDPEEYSYSAGSFTLVHRKNTNSQNPSDEDFLTTTYNNQLVQEDSPEEVYRIVEIGVSPNTGKVSKVKGVISNLSGFNWVEPPYRYLNNSDTLIMDDYNVERTRRIYTVGLGEVYRHSELLDKVSKTILIGYVINGDTTGIVTPDEELLVTTSETQSLIDINVFPTYSDGFYNIAHQETKSLSFEIYNINGTLVLENSKFLSLGNTQVDIRGAASGLYFLKVKSQDGIRVFKVMKY